ncbi:MAG: DNA repair protein RecN [Acidobacteriota bacterium]
MLRYLNVRNLAVIESLEVTFEAGLNVVTGETGAGKSIVIGAVGLLLGDRAPADVVRTGEETAIVQAVFEHDGREVVVRREVSAQGRSRGFVDGVLVTASALKELGRSLVDLHGQHEHQVLLDPDVHLDLLDQFAGLGEDRAKAAGAFEQWAGLAREAEDLERKDRDRQARQDFLSFQLEEIERVAPRAGEDEELDRERRVLRNAERLRRLSDEAYAQLYERDDSVIAGLASVWRRVADVAQVDGRLAPFLDMKETIDAQLDELATSLREYATHIDASPERLQDLEDRLASLERVKRRYGPALCDVLSKRDACRLELAALGSLDARKAEVASALEAAAANYVACAACLSRARRDAAPRFSDALVTELRTLAMERTRFEVRFDDGAQAVEQWTPRGFDRGQFFVSPNPGEDLRPLARVASGGELSRVMLALKTLASTDAPGKTLIFDEVDAGIGGRVADIVGQKLQALGRTFQIVCITHLPQIAASGHVHFRVTKHIRSGRTVTSVDVLGAEERAAELARMLAGEVVSAGALSTAREMLEARRAANRDAEAKGEGERRKRKSSPWRSAT